MKRVSVFVVLAAATSFLQFGTETASAQPRGQVPHPEKHIQGRVLVQPRPGLSLTELDNIIKPHGARRGEVIKQINVHVIELPPQANAVAVADALRKNRHLKFAELDGVLEPAFLPNDPQYAGSWYLPKIGTPTAWDSAQGAGVTIAILDTGVDATHPDLQAQIVPGWNFYDGNNNVADVHGHGTSVAGIAAAAGNNSIGTASVSFRSKIMPMRVTDTAGNGFFSLIASAVTWAADNGARVANVSFLGLSTSSSVDSAAQYMRSKGGVVVTSGGNTGALRTEPVLASLTVVASTDDSDVRAGSSSWGDYIDVAAPGLAILTTLRGGGYGYIAGTSAASPVAAGTYALMMSAKAGLAPATYDSILFSTALDLGAAGWDQYFGNGRVNAAAAVAKALQTTAGDTQPPTVAIASPGGGKVSGLVPVDTTATDNVAVARVELLANGTVIATDTTAPFGATLDTSKYPDGALNLQAKAYDAAGNSASSSTVTVTVANDTIAPTVTIQNPAAGSTVSGTVAVSVAATDNQKVSKIILTIDGKEVANSYGSTLAYSWAVPRPKGKQAASSTISARAEDAAGNIGTRSVTVNRK
jgi:hypothetical protein